MNASGLGNPVILKDQPCSIVCESSLPSPLIFDDGTMTWTSSIFTAAVRESNRILVLDELFQSTKKPLIRGPDCSF